MKIFIKKMNLKVGVENPIEGLCVSNVDDYVDGEQEGDVHIVADELTGILSKEIDEVCHQMAKDIRFAIKKMQRISKLQSSGEKGSSAGL